MTQIEISKVKESIVKEIAKKYTTMDNFLETDFGKTLGKNVKAYLYPSGAVSYPVLKKLCKHLGLGELEKRTVVVRTVEYTLSQSSKKKRNSRIRSNDEV